MLSIKPVRFYLKGKITVTFCLALLSGCAGATSSASRSDDFVEVQNPGFTMSPTAPETIWVPRSSLQQGIPRGGELAKQGYQALKGAVAPAAPRQAALVDPSGAPAGLIPHFGQVVALDGERLYFNLGREDGVLPGRTVQVYRGGTVVKGLGLAPGEQVATLEVQGLAGSRGAYGVVKQGGPVRVNDLVGCQ
jgi:hypothetical protein